MILTQVSAAELSPEDLVWLAQADEIGTSFNSLPLVEIVRGIWSGEFLLYRVTGGGVFLFEIAANTNDKRLCIVRAAGLKLTLKPRAISQALQHIARDLDCTAIEAVVYSEQLAKALARGGAELESYTMVLESSDG